MATLTTLSNRVNPRVSAVGQQRQSRFKNKQKHVKIHTSYFFTDTRKSNLFWPTAAVQHSSAFKRANTCCNEIC